MYTNLQNDKINNYNQMVYNNIDKNNEKKTDNMNEKNVNKKSLISILKNFLDTKADSILSVAAATAIAFGFKDLVLSIATNIIHPLFIKLILVTKLNNYLNIGDLGKSHNMLKNLMNFITTLFSFVSILVITYYSLQALNNTFNILNKY
jgi:large-conductance mechanosensitive channel